MYVSNHNVLLKTPGKETVIFNALWGSMDILDPNEVEVLEKIKTTGDCYKNEKTVAALLEAGYVCMNETVENAKFTAEYQEFVQHVASMPENFFIIPSYACNLACVYCFQEDVEKTHEVIEDNVIDQVFRTIDTIRAERGNKGMPQITVYGGEPLLDNKKQIKAVKRILEESRKRGFKKIVVTNGVTLKKFVTMLADAHIDEVHVTLDGCREVHDARRMMKGGQGTFDVIVEGIKAALKAGLNIHLRVIVDKNNLERLPDLIQFLDEQGWLDNPKFRMHVGRIYECGAVSTSPYKEKYYIGLIDLIRYWAQNASQLKGVDFGFRGIKQALYTGKVPSPLFSYCPSCTNEFVFDLRGDIYPCPGGCGDTQLRVGTFYPQVEYFDIFHKWRSRTILRIEKCQQCDLALVCGGGCPLENLAEDKDIFEPACTPIREEMQIGVNILYPQLLQVENRAQPVQEPCCCSTEDPQEVISMDEKKTQPECNCAEVKIIPLDEEEE